ncbi:MAG: endonuclease/exonuclease/phosphatase family protein [Armatimonadota bacterium]
MKPGVLVSPRPARACLAVSLLTWLLVFGAYWTQPDSLAFVTAWPAWAWGIVGLLFVLAGWRRPRRAALALCALWLVWTAAIAEEPRALLRPRSRPSAKWQEAVNRGAAFRVVSLNCVGGNAAAAAEVVGYKPDIVLLQESPGKREVERLAHRLFGHAHGIAYGIDTSVISRWPARSIALPRNLRTYCVWARVRLPCGKQIDCLSVRLAPPVFRLDAWRPACWRAYAANRRERRMQARAVARCLGRRSEPMPLVVGGDMNAPGGDAALREFGPLLRDAFGEAGHGLCNTVLNDCPVLRFDQVWVSHRLDACVLSARKTRHSDHRLVACDIVVN